MNEVMADERRRVRKRTWRLAAEVLLAVGVLAVALSTFGGAKAKFDSDEAAQIGTTRYFQTLFVERDLSAEVWADTYWTRTHPMVTRYVIGAWLWSRGHDLNAFDPTYDPNASRDRNLRAGRGPSDEVVAEARVPMRVLAALAVAALYLTVRLAAGPIGGLAAALLALGSPYLTEHLIRAKGEAPMMFFLLAALLAATIALRRTGRARPSLAWGVAAGTLLGLALGAKLTAVLGVVAVAVWAAWAFLAGLISRGRGAESGEADAPSPIRRAWPPGLSWAAVVLVSAGIVFVASNPFLYPDPVGRTVLLLENRRQEMAAQAEAGPNRAVVGLARRAGLVWERSFFHETWGMSYPGWPVEAALALLGAGWLAARAARRGPGADALLLLWVAAFFAGVTWGLGFLLQHYFVPTALTAILLAGLGAGWASRAVWRLVGDWRAGLGYPRPETGAEGEARPLMASR
jgi:hypothetical protein